MRIAFLAGYLSRRASGIREVVEQLSASLDALGHEVVVFGLENKDWHDGDCQHWHGAPVHLSSVRGPRSLGYAPGWRKRLIDFSPDVVHVHGLWMASSSIAASWRQNNPESILVISPHGMLSPIALEFSPVKKKIASLLYQNRCFTECDLLHATSSGEADEIINYGLTAPISTIPNGVNDMPAHLIENCQDRSLSVISLGRLHKKKAIDRLIRVWERLELEFPNWNLQIFGADEGDGYMSSLRGLTDQLGLKRVHFRGVVLGEDKWRALKEANVFVLPSDNENFALTVPEALLSGLPVVSTDGAPWAMLSEKGCGWSVARSEEALGNALVEAMSLTETQRRSMAKVGREWILSDFSWPVLAERFEEDYALALSTKRDVKTID